MYQKRNCEQQTNLRHVLKFLQSIDYGDLRRLRTASESVFKRSIATCRRQLSRLLEKQEATSDVKAFAYIALHLLFGFCCERSPLFGFLSALIMASSTPFLADTSDWTWFDFAKRYSLLIGSIVLHAPRVLYKYLGIRSYVGQKMGRAILSLNVLEAALLALQYGDLPNAMQLLLCGLCTPPFTYSEQQSFGIADMTYWGLYYCGLTYWTLHSKYWKKFNDSMLQVLVGLVVPAMTIPFLGARDHLPVRVGFITLQAWIDSAINTEWMSYISRNDERNFTAWLRRHEKYTRGILFAGATYTSVKLLKALPR